MLYIKKSLDANDEKNVEKKEADSEEKDDDYTEDTSGKDEFDTDF